MERVWQREVAILENQTWEVRTCEVELWKGKRGY